MSEQETIEETASEVTTTPKPPQRKRSAKRSSFRRLPTPAPSVRGLWLAASDEERGQAHRRCMAILDYWLGNASKKTIAERLETSPVRVWQLGQQALSGMLVGLLRLPRSRAKLEAGSALDASDTRVLKQRLAELEKKLARTEDLVRVLKHLPWQKESRDGPSPPQRRGTKKRVRKKTAQPRATPSDREVARDQAPDGPGEPR